MSQQRALRRIFDGLAQVLGDLVTEGVPVQDEKTGEIKMMPAQASYLAVARQFLKDNNYEADPEKHPGLKSLAQSLPFAGQDEMEAAGKGDLTH